MTINFDTMIRFPIHPGRRLSATILAAATAVLLFYPARAARADVVYLKNGRVHYGKVSGQTRTNLMISTDDKTIRVSKSDIRKVVYESPEQSAARKERYVAWAKRREEIRKRKAELEKRKQEEEARKLEEEKRRQELEELRRKAEAARLADLERQRLAALEKERQEQEQKAEERKQKELEFQQEQAKFRAERAKMLREGVKEDYIEKPDEPIEYWDFAWRSIVVPGWGHRYIGKQAIGWTYTGLSALALYNWYSTRGPALAAKRENEQQVLISTGAVALAAQGNQTTGNLAALYAIDSNRRRFGSLEERVNDHNRALMLLMGVYGIQLTHIILDGLTWEDGGLVLRDIEPRRGLRFAAAVLPEPVSPKSGGKPAVGAHFVLTFSF